MKTKTTPVRNRKNGQYTLSADFDRICKRCGSRLGIHDAEAPHGQWDLSAPECEGFKR